MPVAQTISCTSQQRRALDAWLRCAVVRVGNLCCIAREKPVKRTTQVFASLLQDIDLSPTDQVLNSLAPASTCAVKLPLKARGSLRG